MGLGDPPTTAYHKTSAESGAKILKEGFKSGKSGWNFFITNPSGKAAGSEVANAAVKIETAINTEGAKTISYKQWSMFSDQAKGELGYAEVENAQLTKSQMAEVNALRNQKAVQFMNQAGGDAFVIEAKPGASSGQKFIVMTDKAVEARVTINCIPKGQEAVIAEMEASGVSRASMGSSMFGYGRMALRFAGEGLLIEGVIHAVRAKGEAAQHYVERKSLNGHSPFYNWMMDTYSDVGLYYWYKYSK